ILPSSLRSLSATGSKRRAVMLTVRGDVSSRRRVSGMESLARERLSAERELPRRSPVRWFELRRDIPVWGHSALAAGGFAALLLLWTWLSHRELVNPVFVPTPSSVWEAARDCLGDENLWIDVKASVFRVTAGFFLAAAVGVPVGVAMGG